MSRRSLILLLTLVGACALPAGALAHAGRVSVPSLRRTFGINFTGVVSQNNQWGQPSGAWAHRKPLGWVILIHGGGWYLVGRQYMPFDLAAQYNAKGWGTYTIDYRPGMSSVWDMVAAYDYMRRRVGARVPVCAWGNSAGGQLAMLLAAVRPSLDCVISDAGPTDLSSMAFEDAYAGAGRPASNAGPLWVIETGAVPAFGATGLWDFSPVRLAASMRLPMLLSGSSWDPLVPEPGQLQEMRRAQQHVRTLLLQGALTPPGRQPNFTHASVSANALDSYERAKAQTLAAGIAHAAARRRS